MYDASETVELSWFGRVDGCLSHLPSQIRLQRTWWDERREELLRIKLKLLRSSPQSGTGPCSYPGFLGDSWQVAPGPGGGGGVGLGKSSPGRFFPPLFPQAHRCACPIVLSLLGRRARKQRNITELRTASTGTRNLFHPFSPFPRILHRRLMDKLRPRIRRA